MILKTTKEDLKEMLRSLSLAYSNCISYIAKESDTMTHDYYLKDGKECFGFVPRGNNDETIYVLTMLRGRYKHECKDRPRFLDIGCGIGNIILLAQVVGYATDGIEYDPKTYKVAKQMCECGIKYDPKIYKIAKRTGPRPETKIFKIDMNKFEHYGDYDVLYYYQPMVSVEAMEEFARKLAKDMKPGAYVIAHGSNEAFQKSPEFSCICNNYVWQKKEK